MDSYQSLARSGSVGGISHHSVAEHAPALPSRGMQEPQPQTVLESVLARMGGHGGDLLNIERRLRALRDKAYGAEPAELSKETAAPMPVGLAAAMGEQLTMNEMAVSRILSLLDNLETFA